jgi:hypothetical protein
MRMSVMIREKERAIEEGRAFEEGRGSLMQEDGEDEEGAAGEAGSLSAGALTKETWVLRLSDGSALVDAIAPGTLASGRRLGSLPLGTKFIVKVDALIQSRGMLILDGSNTRVAA